MTCSDTDCRSPVLSRPPGRRGWRAMPATATTLPTSFSRHKGSRCPRLGGRILPPRPGRSEGGRSSARGGHEALVSQAVGVELQRREQGLNLEGWGAREPRRGVVTSRLPGNALGRTRTCNPRFRRPMLYPIELRVHKRRSPDNSQRAADSAGRGGEIIAGAARESSRHIRGCDAGRDGWLPGVGCGAAVGAAAAGVGGRGRGLADGAGA
jgi:hypothetical protein